MALSGLSQPIATPYTVEALIDTGAHTTVINPETVRRLAIRPVGVVHINTPSTTDPLLCNRFHINVYFSESFAIENVFAIEAPMGGYRTSAFSVETFCGTRLCCISGVQTSLP